jgi:transcription antitermination factor NusG
MSFWAVVQTIAQREQAVADRLDQIGYSVLAPKAKMRINGRLEIRALFPGYLFAHVVDGQWYEIRWCIGVMRLVMAGDQPAHLPDWEVDKIQRETKNGLVRLPKHPPVPPKTKIQVGSEIKILTGNFRGCHALYQGSTPRECEIVLLDLLGRKCTVELTPDDRIEQLDDSSRMVV